MLRLCRWCGQEKSNNMFSSHNKGESAPKIPTASKYRKPFGKCKKCQANAQGYYRIGKKPPPPIISFITRPHQCEDCGTSNPANFWGIRKRRCRTCSHKHRYPKMKQWRRENRQQYNLMNNITQRKRRMIESYQVEARFIGEAARFLNKRPAQLTSKNVETLFYLRLFKLTYAQQIPQKIAQSKIKEFEQLPFRALYSLYKYKLPRQPLSNQRSLG